MLATHNGIMHSGFCHWHIHMSGAIDITLVSDRYKGSKATTLALGRWSLGARARRLHDCHQQRHADSGKGAATAAHRRLALAAVVVVRWSKDLNVIFIMFELPCTSCKLME
jgi:hypothetical protein